MKQFGRLRRLIANRPSNGSELTPNNFTWILSVLLLVAIPLVVIYPPSSPQAMASGNLNRPICPTSVATCKQGYGLPA